MRKFEISNGTTTEISFNDYTGQFVMHHVTKDAIRSMGRFETEEEAIDQLHRVVKMWGDYGITEA